MSESFFVHSRCCQAHWELKIIDDEFRLACEKCGKDGGFEFKSRPGPFHQCEACGKTQWESSGIVEVSEELKEKFRKAAREGRIELAPQVAVGQYDDIADSFLMEVLGIDSALITDESSLTDFVGLGDDVEEVLKKIEDIYEVDVSDVEDLNLIKIFERLRILSPRFSG